jgi:dTDP-4-dehydrorhamnose 3,5-epimerase
MGVTSEPEEGIAGVDLYPLHVIADHRGAVLHMLRADSPAFDLFGEIYFSEAVPGAVKAWKRHRRMTQRFAVPVGRMRLVIYDDRGNSSTKGRCQLIELGRPDAYVLVVVPPLLWYGFAAMGDGSALMANCANLPHDPTESEHLDLASAVGRIPYVWP